VSAVTPADQRESLPPSPHTADTAVAHGTANIVWVKVSNRQLAAATVLFTLPSTRLR